MKSYEDYISDYKALDADYADWKLLHKDIRDYILPRRGKFLDDGESARGGEKRHDLIMDATATKSIRTLSAGMHGGLTSPAMRWFRIVPQDIRMVKPGGRVAGWLETVERIFYAVLARSNFYSTIHTFYEEESGFGTGVILTEEDLEKIVRFRICTAGEYRIDNNERGLVDTVYRLYYMNSKQLRDQFGVDVLPDTIQKELEKGGNAYTWHQVLHCSEPNKYRDSRRSDNRNMAFSSVYMLYKENDSILRRSGYMENPYSAARWAVIGNEAYGVCPGHDILGDVKQLQVVTLAKMEAEEKMVRPPMRVPTQYKDVLDTRPDGMNWVDVTEDSAIGPLYNINYDIRGVKDDILDLRAQIREGFYNDLFMMLAQSASIQPKTATEIAALQEEKLIMLGPVIERQFHEVHDPILVRLWSILGRNRMIPPAPEELAGQELKIEYISLLAEAQKRVGVSSVANTVAFVTQLGQVLPAALDKIDVDRTIDIYAELYGAPSGVINDDESVAAIRQSRQQVEQMAASQQMVETLATGAKGAKDLAKAPLGGDNALTAILNQAGGGMM